MTVMYLVWVGIPLCGLIALFALDRMRTLAREIRELDRLAQVDLEGLLARIENQDVVQALRARDVESAIDLAEYYLSHPDDQANFLAYLGAQS